MPLCLDLDGTRHSLELLEAVQLTDIVGHFLLTIRCPFSVRPGDSNISGSADAYGRAYKDMPLTKPAAGADGAAIARQGDEDACSEEELVRKIQDGMDAPVIPARLKLMLPAFVAADGT